MGRTGAGESFSHVIVSRWGLGGASVVGTHFWLFLDGLVLVDAVGGFSPNLNLFVCAVMHVFLFLLLDISSVIFAESAFFFAL